MKKFNWGHGIATGIVLFMSLMAFLVFTAVSEESHLVSEDYYTQEIEYQNLIDKRVNLKERGGKVFLKIEGDQLRLDFPLVSGEELKGELLFLRPSNPDLDRKMPIRTDELGIMILPLDLFSKGLYQVKLDWSSEEAYYQEQEFYMP